MSLLLLFPESEIVLSAPVIELQAATDITLTGATLNGNIISDGNDNITVFGFEWNTTPTSDSVAENTGAGLSGAQSTTITGLTPDKAYYFRAYATNGQATVYTEWDTFTTVASTYNISITQVESITDDTLSPGTTETSALVGSLEWVSPNNVQSSSNSYSTVENLSAWDISGAVLLQYINLLSSGMLSNSVFFKSDGLKMYVCGFGAPSTSKIDEYDLSVAWDVSTAVLLQSLNVNTKEIEVTGLFFKPDGTKLYICGGNNDNINEYDLSVAWDISSATFLQLFDLSSETAYPSGISFKPDGLKLYICADGVAATNAIYEYDLSVAWDVSSAVVLQSFSVQNEDLSPTGLFLKPDGLKMYVTGLENDNINEYDLSVAWDVSSATLLQSLNIPTVINGPYGVFLKPDGTKLYIPSYIGVREYDVTATHYLKCINLGFAIPSEASIAGVIVEIEKKQSGTSVIDRHVRLIRSNGTVADTNRAKSQEWPLTDTYVAYGSATDLWGETWTPDKINSDNFGVVLSADIAPTITASVDHIRITVYHTTNQLDRTADVITRSVNVDDAINDKQNTCTFSLIDRSGNGLPVTDQEVIITLDDGSRLFAGYIVNILLSSKRQTGEVMAQINCVDYARLLDGNLVHKTYESVTDKTIIENIIDTYCAGLGITYTNVIEGVTVAQIGFNYIQPSQAFRRLADLTGRNWYIDYNKDINYFPLTTNTAPFDITDTSNTYFDLSIFKDASQLKNRVYVRGGTRLSDETTFTEKGDGSKLKFNLPDKPHNVSVTVNGDAKTVGIKNIDIEGFDWYLNYQEKYIEQDVAGVVLGTSDELIVTYKYDIPILVAIENTQSIIDNGVKEFAIFDNNITTTEAARDRATAELTDYASNIIEGSFKTYTNGFRSGQYININLTDYSIDADYIVQKVHAQSVGAGLYEYTVSVASSKTMGIIRFLIELLEANRNMLVIDADEDIDELLALTDSLLTDSLIDSLIIDSAGPNSTWCTDSLDSTPATRARWNLFQWGA